MKYNFIKKKNPTLHIGTIENTYEHLSLKYNAVSLINEMLYKSPRKQEKKSATKLQKLRFEIKNPLHN